MFKNVRSAKMVLLWILISKVKAMNFYFLFDQCQMEHCNLMLKNDANTISQNDKV